MAARQRPKYLRAELNLVTEERADRLKRLSEAEGCETVNEYLRRLIDQQEEEKRRQGA